MRARIAAALTGAALAACTPPPGPPDLVLISIDGLRVDLPLRPELEALAAEGLRFERAFSQSDEPQRSLAALLTGRHPSELAPADYSGFVLPDEALTAPEILGLYGYRSGGFVAGEGLLDTRGFTQGFSQLGAADQLSGLVSEALDWLDAGPDQPAFLFVRAACLPRRGGPWFPAADPALLRERYEASALAADALLGQLLDGLEDRGRLGDSLVVVTSGYGQVLDSPGVPLGERETRVPLAIGGGALPEALRGLSRPEPAQAVDLLPTLLAAADARAPAGLPGRDLLGGGEAVEPLVQEGARGQLAIRSGRWRLVFEGLPLPFEDLDTALALAPLSPDWFSLYDLAAEPPRPSVLAQHPAEAEAMRRALIAWRTERAGPRAGAPAPLDPALRELLRSRGYW